MKTSSFLEDSCDACQVTIHSAASSRRRLYLGYSQRLTAGMVFADAPVPALPDVSAERAYSYLEVLAGEIGERPAGSAAESRAVDYIAGQFKSWGLEVTGLR